MLLDGVDVREYRLTDLRSQVSLVSQDVVLFNDTIRNNIAFNAIGKTDARGRGGGARRQCHGIRRAAAAGIRYRRCPIADKTSPAASGSAFRLRARCSRIHRVLILDEATAALDNESERRVQQELAMLMQGRTTLVIAHRLSTVEGADRIIVLDQGRIVEMGNHRELLARGGLYAALHGMQFNA